ncbi:serine protease HTRA2, mitochondrial-like [Danio rerio]|uniref:Serine protease HTRA2, mitochondrial-like n=2 Tax=Danio rerio TaxID=7955 RepID=A0AC58H460_DANRE
MVRLTTPQSRMWTRLQTSPPSKSMLSIIEELRMRDPSFPDVFHGVLIHRVIVGSPANRAGMKPGDVIIEINGVKVNTSEEIYNAVRTSESLNVVVRRGADLLMLHMTPESTE